MTHTCLRCGRDWFSKSDHPTRCAKCSSPYWDKPLVRSTTSASRKKNISIETAYAMVLKDFLGPDRAAVAMESTAWKDGRIRDAFMNVLLMEVRSQQEMVADKA